MDDSQPAPGRETERLAPVASAILERRKERSRHFDSQLFEETGWEVILELYIRESSNVTSTTAQLKIGLGISASSMARSLLVLEQEELVARLAHPLHPGIEYVELTPRAREALERYLATVQYS